MQNSEIIFSARKEFKKINYSKTLSEIRTECIPLLRRKSRLVKKIIIYKNHKLIVDDLDISICVKTV